jgi:hypothetical protein
MIRICVFPHQVPLMVMQARMTQKKNITKESTVLLRIEYFKQEFMKIMKNRI